MADDDIPWYGYVVICVVVFVGFVLALAAMGLALGAFIGAAVWAFRAITGI